MHTRNFAAFRTWALLGASVVLASCGSPERKPDGEPARASSTEAVSASAPLPWTSEFQARSTLIADEVTIDGPPGLIDHVAFTQVPDQHYEAKTTPDGFLQEVTCPEGSPLPIRVQLDNLTIAAVTRVRVLERVGEGPVRVRARGEAYWKNLDTGQEQRAETVELVGARPR